MIPDDTIAQIRDASDIVQIIGEHVALKRVGQDYRGPCPFHQGTHRNFSVSAKRGTYKCFVCGEGGDVFTFLQKRLGLDWPGAVRLAGEKAGIEVRETTARRDQGPDPREPLWEVNAAAAEYFQRALWDDEMGRGAREYLAQRGISREVAERFGMGWAPREIGLLRAHLNALGFEDDRLLQAGLLVRPEEESEPRPRFRARVIFPIADPTGHAAGFGGRLIGPGEPKYLNSGESATFSKGKLLYNLYAAKSHLRRDERVLVVEGYFDVIRLVAAGIESVVAPLGTALTELQAKLLTRYTKNVFLLYDSDPAGLKATFRAGDELLQHGMAVHVVTLPEGEDPDTFVARHGKDALEAAVAGAIDIFERKIQLLERGGWFSDLRRKRRAIDSLLPTIRATTDPVMRDLYLNLASQAAGVGREILEREMEGTRRTGSRGDAARGREHAARQLLIRSGDRRAAERRADGRGPRVVPKQRGDGVERVLVRTILHVRAKIDQVAESIGPEHFHNVCYRGIFELLLELGEDATVEQIADGLEDPCTEVLQELLGEAAAVQHVETDLAACIAKLLGRELRGRLRQLPRLVEIADPAQKELLRAEEARLKQELQKIDPRLLLGGF